MRSHLATLFLYSLLALSDAGFGANVDGPDCDPSLRTFARTSIRQNIAQIETENTSYTNFNYPLAGEAEKQQIMKQVVQFFGGESQWRKARFFSQFAVDAHGQLHTIVDPTFEKDPGLELAALWTQDNEMRRSFQGIYRNIEKLTEDLRFALPETELQLAEVVFTLQLNKPSENWHIDWYDQEYLVGTQTVLAFSETEDGSLKPEGFAGTEYLLFGRAPSGAEAIFQDPPQSIEFQVNANPPVKLVGKGFFYASPTGVLSIHSGTRRVHGLLNIPGDSNEYSLVSPLHRGSYKSLVVRASLAIRFKPRQPQNVTPM